MKALAVKAMKKYFSALPATGGPSLKVEMRIMENKLMGEIKRLEEQTKHQQANLPRGLEIICKMTCNTSRKVLWKL